MACKAEPSKPATPTGPSESDLRWDRNKALVAEGVAKVAQVEAIAAKGLPALTGSLATEGITLDDNNSIWLPADAASQTVGRRGWHMEERWILQVADAQALVEDPDLDAFMIQVLELGGVTASVEVLEETISVAINGTVRHFKLPGDSIPEVMDSLLGVAAFLLDEQRVVLALDRRQDLEIAAVPRTTWESLDEGERDKYRIVEPAGEQTKPPPPQPPRVRN